MNLTKSQKVLHLIFRIIVFATFMSASTAIVTFIAFGIACEDSYLSYADTLRAGLAACYSYYVLLGIGILSVVFSVICCRCTDVAATVTRTIFMAMAAGLNFIALATYNYIFRYANAYLDGDILSIYGTYSYGASDAFENGVAIAVLCISFTVIVYFVLSITSIVALAKRPAPFNQYGYQQSPYARPGMYNNYPQGYPNTQGTPYGQQGYQNMQGMYQNPQGYRNMQGNFRNPQGGNYQNMYNPQGGYSNPQGGYSNPQGGYYNPQGAYANPQGVHSPGGYSNPQGQQPQPGGPNMQGAGTQAGNAADYGQSQPAYPNPPADKVNVPTAEASPASVPTPPVEPVVQDVSDLAASKDILSSAESVDLAETEKETEQPETAQKKMIGYNPQTGEPVYEDPQE